MFNIYKFYSNDLEILLSIIIISLLFIIIYDKFKNKGKLELFILKLKANILNKDNWQTHEKVNKDIKGVELDFILRICNNKNSYNSLYDFNIIKGNKEIDNNYLYLTDTMKSISGASLYEKLKIINLLPYEVKEEHLKIKLTKEEISNLKKKPLIIKYKVRGKTKKLKLNKYLMSNKQK